MHENQIQNDLPTKSLLLINLPTISGQLTYYRGVCERGGGAVTLFRTLQLVQSRLKVSISDCVFQIGAHGKPVMFLHPKDCGGVLVELEQEWFENLQMGILLFKISPKPGFLVNLS